MKRKTEITREILAWIVAIVIVVGTVMWLRTHYSDNAPEIRKETVIVTDCRNGNQYCVVTVEDHNGNLWDYYSDIPETKGACVVVTWRGNEIVDAE